MPFSSVDLNISHSLKDIQLLRSVMLEIQSVMDRSRVVDLRDKLLTDIKVNAANELYVQYQEFSQRLETQVEQFFQANTAMDNYLSSILEAKQQQLKKTLEIAKTYIELKMQVSAGKNFTYDPVLISYLQNNEVFVDKVHNIIHRLTDFKFPALLLGKDYLGLSDKIVSNDPMYVVLPESDLNHFDDLYHPRYVSSMRKHFYKNTNENILDKLPENQFGLIVSTVYQDTLPNGRIVKHFETIKKLLRPGGSLIFTHFDWNNVKSFELVEQITDFGAQLSDPLVVLPPVRFLDDYKSMFGTLGLSIDNFIPGTTHNLLVVSKPGELKTVKAKKVIGEIIDV